MPNHFTQGNDGITTLYLEVRTCYTVERSYIFAFVKFVLFRVTMNIIDENSAKNILPKQVVTLKEATPIESKHSLDNDNGVYFCNAVLT